MTEFFAKNSHSDVDPQPRTMKIKLTRAIITSNICVKLHRNPSINVGSRARMMFFVFAFFLKIATVTLTLSPGL